MLEQIINEEKDPESDAVGEANSGESTVADDGKMADEGGTAGTSATKPSTSPAASTPAGKNILSSDVEIRGKLRFAEDLVVDGRIEGEVNSEGDLTVGENAQIVGDINTRSVVVFGKVEGNISAMDRCELKQSAELNGDVAAGKLAIEEGAVFLGASTVGSPSKLDESKGDSNAASSSAAASASDSKKSSSDSPRASVPASLTGSGKASGSGSSSSDDETS